MDMFSLPSTLAQVNGVTEHQTLQHRINQLQQAASPSTLPPDRAASVARGFEAMFIHELYKTMRQAMLDDPDKEDNASFGADILDTVGGLELAEQLAHSGRGIGIAQLVYRHLTGSEQLPLITKIAAFEEKLATSPILRTSETRPPHPPHAATSLPPQIVERINAYHSTIARAADVHGMPQWLIQAVIAAESAGIPHAVSPAGAKGLMQLMDSTAAELGVRNVFDPEENIFGGTRYLRMMLDRFGSIPLALAAYNAGPGAVQRWGGIPPYRETQQYIQRVQQYAQAFRQSIAL